MRAIRRTRGRYAASAWISPNAKPPAQGRSYLISASYGGIETFDVAFYNGKRPDGSYWWTLANVEIDANCIAAYAEIRQPEGASR